MTDQSPSSSTARRRSSACVHDAACSFVGVWSPPPPRRSRSSGRSTTEDPGDGRRGPRAGRGRLRLLARRRVSGVGPAREPAPAAARSASASASARSRSCRSTAGCYNRLSITSRDPRAPLAGMVTATGDSTSSIEDLVVGDQDPHAVGAPRPRRPSACASRPSCRTPRTRAASAWTRPTSTPSVLVAKTVQSVRIVGNGGLGILGDPTRGDRQNDVLTYGVSFARALTNAAEMVGEVNGRVDTRDGRAAAGHREPGPLARRRALHRRRLARRRGDVLRPHRARPELGFAAGFTYVFNAFTVP